MFAQRLSLHGLVLSKDRSERSSTDLTQVQTLSPLPSSSLHNFFPSIPIPNSFLCFVVRVWLTPRCLIVRPSGSSLFFLFRLKHDVRHRCEMSHLKLDAAEHTVCVCLCVCHSSLTQDNRLGPCPCPSQPLPCSPCKIQFACSFCECFTNYSLSSPLHY